MTEKRRVTSSSRAGKEGEAGLWEPVQIAREVSSEPLAGLLAEGDRAELEALPPEELRRAVEEALQRPQPVRMPHDPALRRAVHAAQYCTLFAALDLPRVLSVYEPCAGASHPVAFATEAYSNGRGRYATVNLNRLLRAELEAGIAHLKSTVELVDDNALCALNHFPSGSFDAACFHHAINDILQTVVAEKRGMDTATLDWWPNERRMIEWLAEDFASGGLGEQGRPELLHIVAAATELVRPGGYLMFDHWAWLGHREENWFPWELFCDLIPMARRWIAASSLPLRELQLSGAEPQWWMFFRVEK